MRSRHLRRYRKRRAKRRRSKRRKPSVKGKHKRLKAKKEKFLKKEKKPRLKKKKPQKRKRRVRPGPEGGEGFRKTREGLEPVPVGVHRTRGVVDRQSQQIPLLVGEELKTLLSTTLLKAGSTEGILPKGGITLLDIGSIKRSHHLGGEPTKDSPRGRSSTIGGAHTGAIVDGPEAATSCSGKGSG